MWEGKLIFASFEDGGKATTKKCWQSLEAGKGKGKEMDSPLEPPEGMQPSQCLDFSLVRPISDFWPSEL